jgi:hypothetical protein
LVSCQYYWLSNKIIIKGAAEGCEPAPDPCIENPNAEECEPHLLTMKKQTMKKLTMAIQIPMTMMAMEIQEMAERVMMIVEEVMQAAIVVVEEMQQNNLMLQLRHN